MTVVLYYTGTKVNREDVRGEAGGAFAAPKSVNVWNFICIKFVNMKLIR